MFEDPTRRPIVVQLATDERRDLQRIADGLDTLLHAAGLKVPMALPRKPRTATVVIVPDDVTELDRASAKKALDRAAKRRGGR